LRTAVLGPATTVPPAVGLTVFFLRGMAGWMDALPTLTACVEAPPDVALHGVSVACKRRSYLVYVLADMVLSCAGGES
jgi:hypothetical protein